MENKITHLKQGLSNDLSRIINNSSHLNVCIEFKLWIDIAI